MWGQTSLQSTKVTILSGSSPLHYYAVVVILLFHCSTEVVVCPWLPYLWCCYAETVACPWLPHLWCCYVEAVPSPWLPHQWLCYAEAVPCPWLPCLWFCYTEVVACSWIQYLQSSLPAMLLWRAGFPKLSLPQCPCVQVCIGVCDTVVL